MEANRDLIIRTEEAQDRCRGCSGNCWQGEGSRGMIPVLNIIGDSVYEAVSICRYERQRREQTKLDRLFQSAKVPRAYARDTFSDYDVTPENREAVRAARWMVANESGRGLFFYGPRGTGKTKLAAIIANERVRKGKPVLFSSVPDLMGDIRATFRRGNTEETLQSVVCQ